MRLRKFFIVLLVSGFVLSISIAQKIDYKKLSIEDFY